MRTFTIAQVVEAARKDDTPQAFRIMETRNGERCYLGGIAAALMPDLVLDTDHIGWKLLDALDKLPAVGSLGSLGYHLGYQLMDANDAAMLPKQQITDEILSKVDPALTISVQV